MRTPDTIIAAARGCLGARFRPQGRDPRFGLDCIGVAAIAFARPVPSGYAMRGGAASDIAARIDASGLVRVYPPRHGEVAGRRPDGGGSPLDAAFADRPLHHPAGGSPPRERGGFLAPGDLLLIEAGPHQYHLAILTCKGFVHADARLRRVVETPGRPQGIIAAWREQG